MANDRIFVDTRQINRLAIELRGFEEEVGEAAYHALNRTIDHVITKVGQIVPRAYAVKSTEVKDTFRGGIRKPTRTNLSASLISKGHTLSIAHFPHSPRVPGTRVKKIKVTIKREEGRKEIQTEPKPFLARTGARSADGVQYNVFRRKGEERLPITVVRTLSIPQMITNEKISEQIQEIANKKLEERLQHEIIRRMTSTNRRVNR